MLALFLGHSHVDEPGSQQLIVSPLFLSHEFLWGRPITIHPLPQRSLFYKFERPALSRLSSIQN